MPVIFQTSGHTKKECLKDGWLPEKIRISNMLLRISTHSRDTPHGNHRLLSYSFSIAFRGPFSQAFWRPPTQKSFSPRTRWRIALTPRAMPLFTIGRNTISKRLNGVSMGPSLDKTNVSTAQENKLYGWASTLPYCTQYRYWCRHLQYIFILAPKFVRP